MSRTVKGFHLVYDDSTVDPNIKNWDVTVLTVNKTKRHLDATAVFKFWKVLDQFASVRKPHLDA